MKTRKILPLFLFLFVSFSLARCASLNIGQKTEKYPRQNTEKVENKDKDDKKNTSLEQEKRKKIIQFAKKHVGINYKYAGKSPAGFDCSGFTYFIAKKFDISINTTSKSQENNGKKIEVKNVKPGDLIFFRRSKNSDIFHVAMVYSNDNEGIKIIHSTSSRGVVIDKLNQNKYWEPKISTARDVVSQ